MEILNLPPEIFSNIIHNLVTNAGIDEAWSLRGVCDTFARYIKDEVVKRQPISAFTIAGEPHPTHRNYKRLSWARATKDVLGVYLFYRTKNLLDAHSELPSIINRSVDWLLPFLSTTIESDVEDRHDDVKMQLHDESKMELCKMVAGHEWYYTACLLRDGIAAWPAMEYWRAGGYLRLGSGEEDVADKLAVATFFSNDEAISSIITQGGRIWKPSRAFGYPLVIAATYGRQQKTVDLLLGTLSERVSKKDAERHAIIEMFRNTINALVKNEYYNTCARLVSWLSNHVTAVPKEEYNKLMSDALRSRHLPYIKHVLTFKLKTTAQRVTREHFEVIMRNHDISSLKHIIENSYIGENPSLYSAPLAIAAKHGFIKGARELLKAGADPNGPPSAVPKSPLYNAVAADDHRMVKFLLRNGARVHGHPTLQPTARDQLVRCAALVDPYYDKRRYTFVATQNGEIKRQTYMTLQPGIYKTIFDAARKESDETPIATNRVA